MRWKDTFSVYKKSTRHAFWIYGSLFLGVALVVDIFLQVQFYEYTPEKSHSIFKLLDMSEMQTFKHVSSAAAGDKIYTQQKKVLICTMLSDDFAVYSTGAVKLAAAIHKDMPILQASLNVFVETAVLELVERPVPLKIWMRLKEAGWQRKITLSRIAPRHEGMEVHSRFKDQFTKLQLWNMDQQGFDWVLYMDSDIFVLRSIVPLLHQVFELRKGKDFFFGAIQDFPAFPGSFNMALFALTPNSAEFQRLVCLLYGKCPHTFPQQFAEDWAEQGFLNAVYEKNWTEIPWIHNMNIGIWTSRRDVWDANATHIQIIHFNMVKPWNWWCAWTSWAPLCYLFWHKEDLQFHSIG